MKTLRNPYFVLTLALVGVIAFYSLDHFGSTQGVAAATTCTNAEDCGGADCGTKADCAKTGCGCGCQK